MQSRDNEIEIVKNQKVELGVGVAENLKLGSIFMMFLKDIFHTFLEETGKYFMFPLAAMAAIIKAALAWRQVKLEKGEKKSTILRAAVETATAAAIAVAVVGSLVAASIFATVAPIIFVVALAAKTVYHFFASIYYGVKAAFEDEPKKKQEYKDAAYTNIVGFVSSALSTIAVGFVMIAAKPAIAIVGIISAAIGVAYGLYKIFTTPTPPALAQQAGYAPVPEMPAEIDKPGTAPGPAPSVQARLAAANTNASAVSAAPASAPAPTAPVLAALASDNTSATPKAAEQFAIGNKPGSLLAKRGLYAQPFVLPATRAGVEPSRLAAPAA